MRDVEIGSKRRLTASSSVQNLQDKAASVAMNVGKIVEYKNQELGTIETEIDAFLSAALDGESSSDVRDPVAGSSSVDNLGSRNETIWEELLNDDIIASNPSEKVISDDKPEFDMEVED